MSIRVARMCPPHFSSSAAVASPAARVMSRLTAAAGAESWEKSGITRGEFREERAKIGSREGMRGPPD